MSNEEVKKRLTSQSFGVFGRVDDFDAAVESGHAVLSEVSLKTHKQNTIKKIIYLSSSTSKNLGLDNAVGSRQVLGDFEGLFRRSGHVTFWSLDAILVQQVEGHVLMDRELSARNSCGGLSNEHF